MNKIKKIQLPIRQIFNLRFSATIPAKDCCSSFLVLSKPGIIAIARAHIGGSTQTKKPQPGTWEQAWKRRPGFMLVHEVLTTAGLPQKQLIVMCVS